MRKALLLYTHHLRNLKAPCADPVREVFEKLLLVLVLRVIDVRQNPRLLLIHEHSHGRLALLPALAQPTRIQLQYPEYRRDLEVAIFDQLVICFGPLLVIEELRNESVKATLLVQGSAAEVAEHGVCRVLESALRRTPLARVGVQELQALDQGDARDALVVIGAGRFGFGVIGETAGARGDVAWLMNLFCIIK